jgi:hypothetical protein
VAVQFAAGKAAMHVDNLHLLDYHTIPNALALGPNDPAVVSFDVVWSGPIMRRVSVLDGTLGNNYAGEYVENQVTVTWSGTNLTTGFTFTANPGTIATSVVDGGFAELGHERNGIFSHSDSPSGGGSSSGGSGGALLAPSLVTNDGTPAPQLGGQAGANSGFPFAAGNPSGPAVDAVFKSPALLGSVPGDSSGLNNSQTDYGFLRVPAQPPSDGDSVVNVLSMDSHNGL